MRSKGGQPHLRPHCIGVPHGRAGHHPKTKNEPVMAISDQCHTKTRRIPEIASPRLRAMARNDGPLSLQGMALYGPPRANEMRKTTRGRGGAAHAGGARGVIPRSNPFLFRTEQCESDAQLLRLIFIGVPHGRAGHHPKMKMEP
jgi:hypothetical protein